MFESDFAAATDAELIAAIEDGARAEAAEAARQLAAIAELTRRRVDEDDERAMWAFDAWDSAAAEVGSALNVGHRRASGRMRIAMALRDRVPRVAALHRRGLLSSRIVSTITWATHLVEDEEALALIDDALADRAIRWGPLSEDKLRQAIDVWVDRYDPNALRRTQTAARSRDFTVGACDDDADTTSVWGRLLTTMQRSCRRASPRWPKHCATQIRAAWVSAAPTPWARWLRAMSVSPVLADHPPAPHPVSSPNPTSSSG